MKIKQFLFLAVLLTVLMLALASCELPFDIPFLGGEETTTTTEVATTTEPTVTTTTTGAGVIITLPPVTAAPNPITEVRSLNTKNVKGLRLTFKDKKTMMLEPELGAQDGYNSVTYTYSFDKNNGILSLTMTDNAANNVANQHLKLVPDTLSVKIRENNKNLEWAYESSDDWTVLCKTSDTNAKPLALLRAATGYAKMDAPTETGVYLTIKDGVLRFRAREWKNGTDLCMDTNLTGSSNKVFNINYLREISSTAALEDTTTGTTWKGTSDDITPININGTYIGANHGYFIIAAVENPSVGRKTEEDIGSIWKVGNQQYVLVKVDVAPKEVKQPRLWFCPISDTMMETGVFTNHSIDAGAVIEHVSGATNTQSFTTTAASTQCQFYNALNHNKMAAFLNGNVEVDIYKNAVYHAEFIDFYEEYDIIYLPTMLQYLIDNVGDNTNDSHCDESLNDAYVTFRNTYRYHKNGACVIYSSYIFHKNINMGYIGGVQSGPFSESDHYVYIPGANGYTTPTFQNGRDQGVNTYPDIKIGKDILVDPDYLTTTYFQLTSPEGTKAMNLGFNPEFGFGVNETRWDYIDNTANGLAFYYQNSYKMYPKLVSGGKIAAGTVIDCIAYRLPSERTDEDFFVINWYWVGDDIYLSLHTDKAVDERTVALPEYMNGMTVTPVEKSDSFTIVSETINGGITVSTSANGYTIVKLSPAN